MDPEGFVAQRGQGGDLLLDFGQARGDGLQQPLAFRRSGDVTGGAGQQADAHAGLQLLDGMAQRRLRHADPGRRAGEAALFGHDTEPGELVEVGLLHESRLIDQFD